MLIDVMNEYQVARFLWPTVYISEMKIWMSPASCEWEQTWCSDNRDLLLRLFHCCCNTPTVV